MIVLAVLAVAGITAAQTGVAYTHPTAVTVGSAVFCGLCFLWLVITVSRR